MSATNGRLPRESAGALEIVPGGGVTTPLGFRAAGVACGLKKRGDLDLALLVSDLPASAGGVFTANRVKAAPVRYSRAALEGGRMRAVIVNAGNANACTGEQGDSDCREMAELTADALGISSREVLVASTGVIGMPLDMDCLRRGIPHVVSALERSGGEAAAEAILTTDSGPKTLAVDVLLGGGRRVRIGGMAKGAGMIRPNLATTLGFLTTDADLPAGEASSLVREVAELSFNRITVDGDTSTNDCLLLLANGAAGHSIGVEDRSRFVAGLLCVARELARMVVRDGEGATKLVEVRLEGAASDEEATRAAFAVAESLLVKTALHGGEPNWGRILSAVGRSGVDMEEGRVAIWFNDLQVVSNGLGAGRDLAAAAAELEAPEIVLRIDLGVGSGRSTVWTCDLSEEYVRINGSYIS